MEREEMWIIRNVKTKDLTDIAEIEKLCFLKEEAAPKEVFVKRIQMIPDSFFVAEEDGLIMGFINGPVIDAVLITDDLFEELKANPVSGGHQSVLGLAVSPRFQKQGIATALLDHLEKEAREHNREVMTLTCKQNLIGFYENHGYYNAGVSTSQHGGAVWYNMIKKLQR